jgi:hypothetical protein
MSSLKYQLRELLPSLSEQAKGCKDQEVKRRLYLVKAIVNSERTLKAACDFRGVCRDTFYRWTGRLLKQKKIEALKDDSKRPKRSPNQTSPRIERKIRVIKRKEPYLGPDRISYVLEEEHAMECPPSTVYAVLRRNKLISKEYRKQRTKKHIKRYRQPIPGYLQMDFKYVPLRIEDNQYYQLSAIDHCTSWRFIRCYQNKGEEQALEFLQVLRRECPFAIIEIQTDNDAAFTDKYSVGLGIKPTGEHPMDQWCWMKGIKHKLIPVGEKELNGKVENSHKFDDEEFYSQNQFKNFTELQTRIYAHNDRWNNRRPTKSLGWRTPSQLVLQYKMTLAILEGWLLDLQREHNQREKERELINQALLIKKQVKKPSAIDRYLAWVDWDAKKGSKYALLPVSYISTIYSLRSREFFMKNRGTQYWLTG